MAHQMSERELRNLRRNLLREEEETQRQTEEAMANLQSQREQHLRDRSYRMQLLGTNSLADRSQVRTDMQPSSAVSPQDNSVFLPDEDQDHRQISQAQGPRSILKKTPCADKVNSRVSETEQDRRPSNVTFARRLTYSQEHEQGQGELTRDLRSMAMSVEDADYGLIDQVGSYLQNRSGDRIQDNRTDSMQTERTGSERMQSSFLNFMDREIEDMDRRLNVMLTSGSEILEKNREMLNRSYSEDWSRDESLTGAKTISSPKREYEGARPKTRIDYEQERNRSRSQEEGIQFMVPDSNRRFQEYSGLRERSDLQRMDVANSALRSERVDTSYDRGISRYDTNQRIDRNVVSDRPRSAINAIDLQVEQLLQLRQRLDEAQHSAIQTEPLDLRTASSDISEQEPRMELLQPIDMRLNLPQRDQYSTGMFHDERMNDLRYRERIERPFNIPQSEQIRGQENVRNLETRRESDYTLGRQRDSRDYRERSIDEMVNVPVKRENSNEVRERTERGELRETLERMNLPNEQSEVIREEIPLLEDRKRKEEMLKEREIQLIERERKLNAREVQLEKEDYSRRTLTDRYDQLLKEKESDIEKRMKMYKERKAQIEQTELQRRNEDEERRLKLMKLEQGLEQEEQKLDTLENRNPVERREISSSKDREKILTFDVSDMTTIKDRNTATVATNTGPMLQDSTNNFPKMSVFSGEDPKPKSEASFEEWAYEVKYLSRRYSEAVMGQVIRKALKGHAKQAILPMGPDATVSQILHRLEGVFGNVATPMSILQEFYTVYQKQDESVSTWSIRLEEILQRAVDKGQVRLSDKDALLRDKFWRSLRSEKLKMATILHFNTCETFDLLREKVRTEELAMQLSSAMQQQAIRTERPATKDIPDSKADLILERLTQLEKKVNNRKPWWKWKNKTDNEDGEENQNQNAGGSQSHQNNYPKQQNQQQPEQNPSDRARNQQQGLN